MFRTFWWLQLLLLTRKAQTSCTKASAWLQCHVLSQIPDGSQILWKIYLLCTAGYYSGIEIPDISCMFQINGRLNHFDLYTFGKEIIPTRISCVSNERMCEDTFTVSQNPGKNFRVPFSFSPCPTGSCLLWSLYTAAQAAASLPAKPLVAAVNVVPFILIFSLYLSFFFLIVSMSLACGAVFSACFQSFLMPSRCCGNNGDFSGF